MQNNTLATLYKELHTITQDLLDNFTDENVITTIGCRAELLKKIEHLKEKTSAVADVETRAVMAKIIDLDKVLANKIHTRMGVIKSEINGLYSKSRAAVAYTANKK
jgi:hypothetical protein